MKRNRLLSDSDQSGKEFDNGDECDGDISDEEDEAGICAVSLSFALFNANLFQKYAMRMTSMMKKNLVTNVQWTRLEPNRTMANLMKKTSMHLK